ncbi:Auxin-binding protein [Pelomonas sp. Root1217]|uniref:FixH family protein n=1 Tax=Pelomonas sp. Root1217 TaxID=1736430 RepID=UPI00070BBA83|nr:FixH family protein [Pelomonas sp. Root1217]KQV60776.1 Auxin-binding protein [Pelomonas sp. Root1217]
MKHHLASPLLLSLLLFSACMTPPQNLDLSLSRPTAQNKYRVSIQPMVPSIAINQLHAWQVQVTSPSGEPVLHAHIDVDGGMPQHGHGLPTQPAITQELGGGRYLMEGMKFSMTGWWEIKLKLDSAERGADAVTFNKVIALPTANKT